MVARWISVAAAPMLLYGCAAPESGQPLLLVHGAAEVAGTTPAWCYSTLADADCYIERDPEARDRLIGAYVPVHP